MSLADISHCTKCNDGYFLASRKDGYCCDFCRDTDRTSFLEERVETLENKIEIIQEQLNKCLLYMDSLHEDNEE